MGRWKKGGGETKSELEDMEKEPNETWKAWERTNMAPVSGRTTVRGLVYKYV